MLYVTAIVHAQPEHVDTVGAALNTLAIATRLEAGCERYELFRKLGQPIFITHEIWASEEAETAHIRGENVAILVSNIAQYMAAPAEIHRCSQIT